MTFETLLVERDGALAVVTVNRPKVLNALNSQTIDNLRHAMLDLQRDENVRAIVLTGSGEKAFVAGADINELATLSPAQGQQHARTGQAVFDLIEQLGKPVVAAINGFALGGGCELAMACTLRIAADTARLGQPEINLGIMPGYAGSQRLPRLVGKGRALEILLSGEMISAVRAYEIGLVNKVVPAPQLLPEAKSLATALSTKAPIATRYILDAVNRGLEISQSEGQLLEATLFGLVASTDDMREGTTAFLQKRSPSWQGR
jgi:enoyl-CoA hydratase/carnithine racemase